MASQDSSIARGMLSPEGAAGAQVETALCLILTSVSSTHARTPQVSDLSQTPRDQRSSVLLMLWAYVQVRTVTDHGLSAYALAALVSSQ
jgi:hypothetical protein